MRFATLIIFAIGLTGCGAARRGAPAPVPGCSTARVVIPKDCDANSYVRVLDDRTEVHCGQQRVERGKLRTVDSVLTYKCSTAPPVPPVKPPDEATP